MAIVVSIRVEGAKEISAVLTSGAAKTHALMAQVVEKSAHDLVSATQRNASGRPGPNAPTGDYRGSWRARALRDGPGDVAWEAGTDRPQANRLEYGFVGPDSLGRVYDQPPYPHHGPAVDVIEPRFRQAMEKVAEMATGW